MVALSYLKCVENMTNASTAYQGAIKKQISSEPDEDLPANQYIFIRNPMELPKMSVKVAMNFLSIFRIKA